MTDYILILIVTFLAGFTQGLSGFGSILLALPLLTFFLDITMVVPLVALHALLMTILILIQLRKHLEWKKVLPLFWGCLPGVPIGVFYLKHMNTAILQLTLGITLLSYAVFSLFFKPVIWEMKKRGIYLVGFLAGCLGGALGAAGPPVIVYTSLQPWTKDSIKVTLQGFFLASGLVVVLLHALSGLTTLLVVKYFVVSLPALVIGTYVGSFYYGRIGENTYRRIMFVLLAFLGAFMIYGAL